MDLYHHVRNRDDLNTWIRRFGKAILLRIYIPWYLVQTKESFRRLTNYLWDMQGSKTARQARLLAGPDNLPSAHG